MLIPHKVKNKGKYISFHYLRGWKARKIRKVQEISPQISIDVNGHNERLLLQLQKKGFITSYQEKNDRKKRCFEVWVKQQ